MFERFIFKKPEAMESEHLKEGIKPILASVGDLKQQDKQSEITLNRIVETGDDVSWSERNPGEFYVKSEINKNDKFTEGLIGCTSIIAVGKEKGSGEDISFLTHQSPIVLSYNRFFIDIEKLLIELKKRSEEKTIDIVIAGGSILPNEQSEDYQVYQRLVRSISESVTKNFGFNPVVIAGPKIFSEEDDVFFDSKNRRLYILRSFLNRDRVIFPKTIQPFDAGNVENRLKKITEIE